MRFIAKTWVLLVFLGIQCPSRSQTRMAAAADPSSAVNTAHASTAGDDEHTIRCGMDGNSNACCIRKRFCFARNTLESRGAGDVSGHPMIEIGVGEGFGKLVVTATDLLTGEDVFLKCKPPEGGIGAVVGIRAWRGEEVEEALKFHPHVLTRDLRITMSDGGVCSVYPLASLSLTDAIARGSLSPRDTIRSLLDVLRGLEGMHSAGFVHRDLKHRNILFVPSAAKWMLGDLDASGRVGEEVWELMGYPWRVWVPSIQIGQWPSAVPSPEHGRHLESLWRSSTTPPLLASAAHDIFQFGVLVFEVVCRNFVLAGRPGREVLADLASPAPLSLPSCRPSAWASSSAAMEAVLQIARTLMGKHPEARGTLEEARVALERVLAQIDESGVQARRRDDASSKSRSDSAPRCEDVDYCFNVKV